MVESLFELALQAAIANDFWMVQRRQLEAMPEEAANRMVAGLFQRRRMSAGLLALFAQQLSRLHLEAAACWGRPADWLLSAGKCRFLDRLVVNSFQRMPDSCWQHLSPLASTLLELDLQASPGIGTSAADHIGKLTSLTKLVLSGSGIVSARGLTSLQSLKCLTAVGLQWGNEDCQHLAILTDLQSLDVHCNPFTDEGPQALSTLSQLTLLDVSLTHCSRTPPIPSLQVLRMQISGSRHANSLLGGSRAPSVQQHVPILPDLRELQLDSTEWPPWAYKQTLRAAVSLTRLSLSLCHSLPNVNFLKHATALRDLNILGTLKAKFDRSLFCAMPNLQSLNLGCTDIRTSSLEALLDVSKLVKLELEECENLATAGLVVLQQLGSLSHLDISSGGMLNQRYSAQLPEAPPGSMQSMRSLEASGNRLGVFECRWIATHMPCLTHLALGSSKTDGVALMQLAALTSLQSLAIWPKAWMHDVSPDHLNSLACSLTLLTHLKVRNLSCVHHQDLRTLLHLSPSLLEIREGTTALGSKLVACRVPQPAPLAVHKSPPTIPDSLTAFDDRIRYSKQELLQLKAHVNDSEGACLPLPEDLKIGQNELHTLL